MAKLMVNFKPQKGHCQKRGFLVVIEYARS